LVEDIAPLLLEVESLKEELGNAEVELKLCKNN
jgi:hypothetical protein